MALTRRGISRDGWIAQVAGSGVSRSMRAIAMGERRKLGDSVRMEPTTSTPDRVTTGGLGRRGDGTTTGDGARHA